MEATDFLFHIIRDDSSSHGQGVEKLEMAKVGTDKVEMAAAHEVGAL
jgi:hypothetical protein